MQVSRLMTIYVRPLFGAVLLWLGLGSLDRAYPQVTYENMATPEGWAWSKIKQGEIADFNRRCGTARLDPRQVNDTRWQAECRQIPPRFVEDLLTRLPWRDAVPREGLLIAGARIAGDVNLANATLSRSIEISGSQIVGTIRLDHARTQSAISLAGSRVSGTFFANSLQSTDDLVLWGGTTFVADVWLAGAKVQGRVDMTGATLESGMTANLMEVGGDLFMGSDSQNKATFNDVNLRNATVKGALSMSGGSFGALIADSLKVGGSLLMTDASFAGAIAAGSLQVGGVLIMQAASFNEVNLSDAKIAGTLMIAEDHFSGKLSADSLHADSNLIMNRSEFDNVNLHGARVAGEVAMIGARFAGTLTADSLQVGAALLMASQAQHKTKFKDVDLTHAKIAGNVDMHGAVFDGSLTASSLEVGGGLIMASDAGNKTTFREVNLIAAILHGAVDMEGSSFDGALDAFSAEIHGPLLMGSYGNVNTHFKDVNLAGTEISKSIAMSGSRFDGPLNADFLKVDGDLRMDGARFADKVVMRFAHVGGNLNVRGATLPSLDLSGSSVAYELRLGGLNESVVWKAEKGEPGALYLRNASVGYLVDARDAWPTKGHLHLEGFTFAHLGGTEGESEQQMRDARKVTWWDEDWARLDPDYSPTPYARLAAAFSAAGDREAADEIRFAGRVRQAEASGMLDKIWSWILRWVAGYGIGLHTFRVLYWIVGISFLGAVYLRTRVKGVRDAHHGFFWCLGASFARLLPAIEVNKEFTAFFDDPKRERLTGWQSFVFTAIGIVGWIFGLILLAAVSGLTQSA